MGKIPASLRENIARNIRACRMKKYPGRGGGQRCAMLFGVSPQQWSPWERGMRTPDELRLTELADFFGVTVEYLRRDNRNQSERQDDSHGFVPPHVAYPSGSPIPKATAPNEPVYIPGFVLLPHPPNSMKDLYDQFYAALNDGNRASKQTTK